VEEIWGVVEDNEKRRFAVRWSRDPKIRGVEMGSDGDGDGAVGMGKSASLGGKVLMSVGESDAVFDRVREMGLDQGDEAEATLSRPSGDDADAQPTQATTSEATETETETETNRAIQAWKSGTDITESHFLIRATQGHSIKTITSNAELLKPITLDDPTSIPSTCVHGTFYGSWPLILSSGGLKPMGRNHVHFAMGPALSDVLPQGERSGDVAGEPAKVISGMRHDAQILIYVDLKACLEDVRARGVEMEWWKSENDVVLTAGVDPALVQDGAMDDTTASQIEPEYAEASHVSSVVAAAERVAEKKENGNWKQRKHGKQHEHMVEKMVPIKYWTHVVEVKKGLGLIWKQGEGVVKELPADLLAKGTPKGSRGGGRGRGRGRGR